MGLVDEARSLAEGALASPLPRRWAHVQAVAERAASIASVPDFDGDVLTAAAWLHDIGYAPRIALTGFHPLDGARYLRKLNAPERLCALVARHSSAVEEAGLRGLRAELQEFPDEESAERDALWWADMTTTPDGKHTDLNERLKEIRTRYGADHLVTRSIERSTPELTAAVDRTCRRVENWGLSV